MLSSGDCWPFGAAPADWFVPPGQRSKAVAPHSPREQPPLPHGPRRLADDDPFWLASGGDTLDEGEVHPGSNLPVHLLRQSKSVVAIYDGRSTGFTAAFDGSLIQRHTCPCVIFPYGSSARWSGKHGQSHAEIT